MPILLIVALIVYIILPLPLQLVFLAINMIVPDPIPGLDEAIMWVSVLAKLCHFLMTIEFLQKHRWLTVLLILAFIVCTIACIYFLVTRIVPLIIS